jgi:transcriptional regulator with XRE-family HTH domain
MTEPLKPWIEFEVMLTKDNMSLKQLAEISGYSLSYVCDLRKGRRKPNARVIARFAKAMNVPKSMLEPRAEAA